LIKEVGIFISVELLDNSSSCKFERFAMEEGSSFREL
jgi:hypothetical protein